MKSRVRFYHKIFARAAVRVIISMAMTSFLVVADSDMIRLSFDNLYPVSSYRKALNTCMKLYGQLDVCDKQQGNSAQLSESIIDKALQFHIDIDGFLQEKTADIDDVEYLLTLIEHIGSRYELLLLEQPAGKIVHGVLREVHSLLNDVLK